MTSLIENDAWDDDSMPHANMRDPLRAFDVKEFLASAGIGKTILPFQKDAVIFAQGDHCDSIFYVQEGCVKLSVVSASGKEATVALLTGGHFIGEECVSTDQPYRSATAIAVTNCTLLRVSKVEMTRVLQQEHAMSELFVAYLLARTNRIQADLVDQLFNSRSEEHTSELQSR